MEGYGSHVSDPHERRTKLRDLVRSKGYDHTMHHLIWLANITHDKVYHGDVEWLKAHRSS